MSLHIPDTWLWFSIAFGIMLLATFIMSRQGRYFYTLNVVVQKFSIFDLEFPATPRELYELIKGIYNLPSYNEHELEEINSSKVLSALRGQLFTDSFLYMPATYGSIFLLCMKVATKTGPVGTTLFTILAWLQVLAFTLDAIENIYLLHKIKPNLQPSSQSVHRAYFLLEIVKWGSALTAAVCGISVLLHFWFSGLYAASSYWYIGILLAEIAVFMVLMRVTKRPTANLNK